MEARARGGQVEVRYAHGDFEVRSRAAGSWQVLGHQVPFGNSSRWKHRFEALRDANWRSPDLLRTRVRMGYSSLSQLLHEAKRIDGSDDEVDARFDAATL